MCLRRVFYLGPKKKVLRFLLFLISTSSCTGLSKMKYLQKRFENFKAFHKLENVVIDAFNIGAGPVT